MHMLACNKERAFLKLPIMTANIYIFLNKNPYWSLIMQIQKVHLKSRTKDLTGSLTAPDFAHYRDFLEVTVYPSRLIHIDPVEIRMSGDM